LIEMDFVFLPPLSRPTSVYRRRATGLQAFEQYELKCQKA